MVDGGAATESVSTSNQPARHTPLRALAGMLRHYSVVIYSVTLSRLTLWVVGLLTETYVRPVTTLDGALRYSPHWWLNIWGAWDTGWYVGLAKHGYQSLSGADGQANWAFFPGYPALAAGMSSVTGLSAFEAMLVISNLSFFGAMVLVHRLACAEFDRKTADHAVILLCVAPGSYIFSAAYTESLFLLCLTGAFLLIRSRKWMAAGTVAAAAVLTRNLGVGLLLPYAWAAADRLFLDRTRKGTPAPRPSEVVGIVAGALPPFFALAAFMLYLRSRTGDALAFVHVQKAWGRSFGDPVSTLLDGVFHPDHVPEVNAVSFVVAWLVIGLLVRLALLRRPRLFILALFLTLAPLAGGIASFARYALVIFPLWLVLANALAARPRLAIAVVSVFAMLNGFMMLAWTLVLKVTM